MPAYVLIELTVLDPEEMEEYKKRAPEAVAAFDGKFIVRGGAITTLEGVWEPERIVLIQFPSVERAKEWWNSEQYAEVKAIRHRAAKAEMILLEGL